MKDLTTSAIDRQNILNNPEAINNIQKHLGITGMLYENEYRFTTTQIADFYGVSSKTIRRYISSHETELNHNGYTVLKGAKLKNFIELFGHLIYSDLDDEFTKDINVHHEPQLNDKQRIKAIKNLGIFNFRTFLNIGMLLTDSDKAKSIRSVILDIVIDSLNQKLGGSTTYINQRDEEFLVAITREPSYRKEFTSALSRYLDMGNAKYKIFTDAIYQAIFNEKSSEYREVLKLEESVNTRDTMYAEILKLISSFEIGIADEMLEEYQKKGGLLTPDELTHLITTFANKRHWQPLLNDARVKMASRDYGLRDITHERLKPYINSLTTDDYQRFLGNKSKDLLERVIENPDLLEVFKRLKDR